MTMQAGEIDQRVETSLARDEIRQLTALYCYHVIMRNGAAYAELFVEDGVLASANGAVEGREALAGTINGLVENPPIPLIHNHIIDVQGDSATGTCIVESRLGGEGEGGFVIMYDDSYRRVDGRWLFVSRKMNYLFAEGEGLERSGNAPFGRPVKT